MITKGVEKLQRWLNKTAANTSDSAKNNSDKRHHERVSVPYFPGTWVVISDSKKRLGCLIDISLGGFRLLSEKHITPKKTYSVQMEISLSANYTSKMTFQACSSWCDIYDDSDLFTSGFHYVDLSDDARQRVAQIVSVLNDPAALQHEFGDVSTDKALKTLLDAM